MNKKLLLIATIFMVNFGTFIQALQPTISRIYGDENVGQFSESNDQGAYGTLDPSFGSSGSLAVPNGISGSPQAVSIKTLSDGTFLVALDNGTNSYVVKYTSTGALYSTTGGTFGTASVVTLTGLHGVHGYSMNLDAQERILIAGSSDGTYPWIRRLTTTGTTDETFNFIDGTSWTDIYAIAEQTSGKLIVLGYNGDNVVVARYVSTGGIDITFGSSGYVVFDGTAGLPNGTTALTAANLTLASNDSIFVGYVANGTSYGALAKFTAGGTLDTTLNGTGILPAALGSAAMTNYNLITVLDQAGNIDIIGQQGTTGWSIYRYSQTNSNTTPISNATINDSGHSLVVQAAVATTDGNILVIGYDATLRYMRVDSIDASNVAVPTFNQNAGPGYIEFHIGGVPTATALPRGAISADGRLYVAGWQLSGGVTTPYVSRLFGDLTNSNAFISEVAQQPATNEQGTIDYTFGSTQTVDGVVRNFNGLYGATLQETANAITELVSGKFIVGMSGYTNTSATSNMMLQRLNANGTLDTTFGTAGFATLPLHGLSSMVLTSVIENLTGNTLLVSGYSSTSGTLGLYSSDGLTETNFISDTTILQVLGVATQGTQRVIAFEQLDATHGQIAAYVPNLSGLDTTFHATGGTAGKIKPTDFGLTNMGPLYGYAIDTQDDIYVAYKNASTGNVDVAKFYANGSGLISAFATNGIYANLFGGNVSSVSNLRLALDNNGGIIVAAVLTGSATNYTIKRLFSATGVLDTTFGTLTQSIGGTAAVINNLSILNDNTILVTGYDTATDPAMTILRATTSSGAGVLDTTFNPQGPTPGLVQLQIGNVVANYNARSATSMAIQSSTGAMIVSGYEQQLSTLSVPMVMRLYGKPGTTLLYQYPRTGTTDDAGNIDTTFASGGYLDMTSLIAAGVAKTVYAYPSGNTYQGYLLVGVDTGTAIKIARIRQADNTLDTSFGTTGIATIASTTGLQALTVDLQNNVLVAGGSGGTAWAYQLNATGTSPIAFAVASFSIYNDIKQQQSGRYILAGIDTNGKAAVVAFQDHLVGVATTFAIDPTFNPGATTGTNTAGIYELTTTASTNATSIAINSDDTILAVYKDTTVKIAKLTANGSGLVSGFNGGAVLNTTIIPNDTTSIRVAIDSNNKVIVASSVGGTSVSLVRYTSTGATDITFNGGAINNITGLGSGGVALTSLMIDTSNNILFFGYNTGGANGTIFTGRLTNLGLLDTTWNNVPTGTDVQGIHTFTLDGSTAMSGTAIFMNGNVYLAASAGSTVPLLIRMFGNDYVTQYAQQPFQTAAGVLDTTLPGNTSGGLALSGTITGVPQKIYILNNNTNGAMMVASSNGTNSYVTKLNADLSVGTYGSSGVATLTSKANLHDMYVTQSETSNTPGPIYVTGDTGAGAMWGAQINAAGTSINYLASSGTLTTGLAIRQTTNGRILVAGYNGSSGAIAAFTSNFVLDTSFGNSGTGGVGGGVYVVGLANPICAMALDNQDRIYVAYKVSNSTVEIVRLLANGTGKDTSISFSFPGGTAYSASQIRLAIDTVNNQIVVAAQDGTGTGNIIQVARFSTSFGAPNGAVNTVTIASKVLNLSDLVIDAASNIYVIGYNSTDNKSVVARIIPLSSTSLALDTANYATAGGTPGIANVSAGSMTVVTAGAYNPDRRIYLVGSNGSTLGYMARLFGDAYTSEISQPVINATVGSVDTTLYPNLTGGIDLSGQTGWSGLSGGYKARCILENQNGDGSSFIAFGNGTNLMVGKVNADMVPMTAFNTTGLTATQTMATVNNMTQDASGNIIVAGTNGGAQKVAMFSPTGGLLATFDSPGLASALGTTVAQQKSGRYIVGGYGSSNGIISAYQNASAISSFVLPVDPTFGPNGNNGYYATGVNASIDDLVIDSQDYIYFVYRDGSNHLILGKLTPNGSGLVSASNSPTAFNGGSVVDTGIVAAGPVRIAINGAGNVLVGATTLSNVSVRLYNGSTGAAIADAQTVVTASTPALTKLVGSIASTNEFYGTIYNAVPQAIAFAVTSAGILDASFGTAGIVTTTVQSPQQLNSVSIQADGKVVGVGYNNAGAGSTADPILLRFYGYPYVSEYAQAPDQIGAGILDTTLWPTSGALDLATYSTLSALGLSGYTMTALYTYTNDDMLMLFVPKTLTGTSCKLLRMHKDFTLDTSFGSSTGMVTVTGLTANLTNRTALLVNTAGQIFVTGGSSTSFVRAFNADGSVLTGWSNPTSNLSAGAYAIQQQSLGRLIVAGQNTNGVLYGYTSAGVLDTTFGSSGVYTTGVAAPIADCVIDANNNIYLVYVSAGNSVLQKIYPNGSGQVAGFTAGTAISSVTGNNIRVALDAYGNILVAAATTNGFTIARYNATTGALIASQLTIAAGGSSTSVIGQLYAVSNNKAIMAGYETTGNTQVVARVNYDAGNTSLSFDTTFGTIGVYAQRPGANITAYAAATYADDRIYLGGDNGTDPYMTRVFGDAYVTEVAKSASPGVAGTLDTSYHSPTGSFNIGSLDSTITNSMPKATLTTSTGGHYTAFSNGSSASQLIKTTSSDALDTSYNGGGVTLGVGAVAPVGVQAMMVNGSGQVVLVGTNATPKGWIQVYTTTGALNFLTTDTDMNAANAVVQQTLARYVVAGLNATGPGLATVAGYTNTGAVDTTFGSSGKYTFGSTYGIYGLVADANDRLIVAYLNSTSGNVDVARLTSNGTLDTTFGTSNSGIITGALTGVNTDATSVRVALDSSNRIIVAAVASGSATAKVAAFDNLSASSGNGAAAGGYTAGTPITGLTGAVITSLTPIANGNVLIAGYESGNNAMWISSILNTGLLNAAGFNPAAIGGTAGIMRFTVSGSAQAARVLNGLAILPNGEISFVGYETTTGGSPVTTPYMAQAYNDPYQTAVAESPNSLPIGTNDITFGLAGNNGVPFYATGAASNQVAQAVALQGYNRIIAAVNDTTVNRVYLNGFIIDGIADTTFNSAVTAGYATIPQTYENQYVSDMAVINQNGVYKAILAGYAASGAPLNVTGSWLMQYLVSPTTTAVDTSFGGLNQDASGTAFGDIQQFTSVTHQSTGQIIASGLNYDGTGAILGYSPNGFLDNNFGSSGYYASAAATAGIYSHVVDSQDRVLFVYKNSGNFVVIARLLADGSGLDTTFGSSGIVTTAITPIAASSMRVAVDASNNVYVAVIASNSGVNNFVVTKYNSSGASPVTTGYLSAASFGFAAPSTLTLSRLLVDANGKAVVIGYGLDSVSTQSYSLVLRTTAAVTGLDTTTFNVAGTPGYIKYQVTTTHANSNYGLIHPDGRIIASGFQS